MIPELGLFTLILAFCAATLQAGYGFFALRNTANEYYHRITKHAVYTQFIFLCISFICLIYSFLCNDFTVAYVAANSNTHLPLFYRVAATWGAHEGSLLLWTTILSAWSVIVAKQSKAYAEAIATRVLTILGLISVGFILFILLTSNPFARELSQVILDGRDLNPLLQDPGLAFHPPMLYMGYAGFAIPFSFALAGLWYGDFDQQFMRYMRPYLLAAWCCMTVGITLGSWWAYRELGWGGWWFWDPVENASFMPWLLSTALIHSTLVTEKRHLFKHWSCLLAIITFAMSLLGTFLVRSGVLTSVHAFASDPQRGLFLLLLFLVTVGSSLILYACRAHTLRSSGEFSMKSREFIFMINNLLLTVAAASIFIGTLYPLVLDALNLDKISVGSPYFTAVFLPLMIPLLVLMGIGPFLYWKQTPSKPFWQTIKGLFVLTSLLVLLFLFTWLDRHQVLAIIGIATVIWIVSAMFGYLYGIFRRSPEQQRKSWRHVAWPMVLAHLGIAITTLGITISSNFSIERDLRLQPNDDVKVGQYHFKFDFLKEYKGPNYTAHAAFFTVSHQNELVEHLVAEKRIYTASNIALSETAIATNGFRDLYIALGEPLNQHQAWSVRIYYKPMIRFIWLGGILMLLGGSIGILGYRRRVCSN